MDRGELILQKLSELSTDRSQFGEGVICPQRLNDLAVFGRDQLK